MARKQVSEEAAIVNRFLGLTAESKDIFKEVCQLEEQLLAMVDAEKSGRVDLGDGRMLMRKDNFAEKNTQFKPSAFKRFEVVVV